MFTTQTDDKYMIAFSKTVPLLQFFFVFALVVSYWTFVLSCFVPHLSAFGAYRTLRDCWIFLVSLLIFFLFCFRCFASSTSLAYTVMLYKLPSAQRAHDVYTTSSQRRCNVNSLCPECLFDWIYFLFFPLKLRTWCGSDCISSEFTYLLWFTFWQTLSSTRSELRTHTRSRPA